MTTAAEHTSRLFLNAAISDDDLGYPPSVSFVSHDTPDWREITMRNLLDGQPTVLVTEESLEYLLLPHARAGLRGWVDHMRGRQRSEVYWRHGDHAHGGFEANISRGSLKLLERQPEFAH